MSGLGWVVRRQVGDGVRELGDQGEDLAYTFNDMGSHRRGIMGFKGVTLYLCTGVTSHAAEKSSKQRIENWLLSEVKSLSHARLFVTPWIVARTKLLHLWDFQGKSTGVGCHFLLQCMKVKSESEVAQSCPTLSDPMDCSLPGSSIHGIFQARVLEWGAISFSGV